jgi:hypothetical protein
MTAALVIVVGLTVVLIVALAVGGIAELSRPDSCQWRKER